MHLEALRGIAALAVVEGHLGLVFGGRMTGVIAVDLFFMMSGFVIASAYGEKLRRGMSIGEFAAARIIRLYPLYLLAFIHAILVLYFIFGGLQTSSSMLLGAFMLPNPFSETHLYPIILVAWSLFFEVLINLFYCATVRYWTSRNILVFTALSGPVLFSLGFQFQAFDFAWLWSNALTGLARILFAFPVGVLIHNLHADGHLRPRVPSLLVWLLPLLLFFNWDIGPYRPFLQSLMILTMMPALVIVAVSVEPPAALRKLCAALGAISYPSYLLHWAALQPVLLLISYAPAERAGVPLTREIVGVFCLSGFCFLCLLLDRYVDAPVRRFLLNLVVRRPPRPSSKYSHSVSPS